MTRRSTQGLDKPVKQKFFLLLLGFFIAALAFLAFWLVGWSSVKPNEGILISNVSVSTDFEDHQFLAGIVFRFAQGTKQVCLRFDYSRLESDLPIEIFWDWGEKRVQIGHHVLSVPSGTRIYALKKEDGSPLPAGSYAVTIQCGADVKPRFHFEIF